VYLYGLLSRSLVSLVFIRFDPLSIQFAGFLVFKVLRIILVETWLWFWIGTRILKCSSSATPKRFRTVWGTERIKARVQIAGMQELLATSIVTAVLVGEEIAVQTGLSPSRQLTSSLDDVGSLSHRMHEHISSLGIS